MKHIFQLPLGAALALAGAVIAEPVAVVVSATAGMNGEPVDPQIVKQAADILSDALACLNGVVDAMEGARDLAGADAAAGKVAECTATFLELEGKAAAVQHRGPAFAEALLAELYSRGLMEAISKPLPEKLQPAYERLRNTAPLFYGSAKLQAALQEAFDRMKLRHFVEEPDYGAPMATPTAEQVQKVLAVHGEMLVWQQGA